MNSDLNLASNVAIDGPFNLLTPCAFSFSALGHV